MNIKLPLCPCTRLILVVGFFVAFSVEVFAAEGDALLSDNFNDGNLDGWTIESGQWWINNGNLVGAKSGKAFAGRINTGSSEWDNYRIELDVNGFQGIDQGIGFRYSQDNYYEVNLRYGTGIYDTPQIKFWKISGSTENLLTTTSSAALQNNKWYHVRIETLNENTKVWIDNNLVIDFTDVGTNIKKGTLTLSYWTGDISVAYMRFDNIKATALAPPPPPRLPVIFIPGIGGSEFKASQDIVWSQDDGHGGTYSRAYAANEKIWVNQDKAAELGNDDYFDVLRLKEDGMTSEADLTLTDDLTSFGYPDIDSFFTDMGYTKGTNFFVFPYDWRKDVRNTKDSLDTLIESAKTASGQSQVNLIVHSMGGLVARYYISDSEKAAKVNKLIELGVPHLGSVDTVKSLIYGVDMKSKVFGILPLGIPASEVRDVSQNMASIFQMLPSSQYFSFYNNSEEGLPLPFYDDRDIDNNSVRGPLNFNQTKTLLSNLGHNMTAFSFGEAYHMLIDSILDQTNSVKIYEIVGVAQPTLGQIRESWWITWPVNLFARKDEIFINGDNTVPLYSAALINETQNISGATDIYYVDQNHGELVKPDGAAMQTVKAILNDDNSAIPVLVKDVKIDLEGDQISLDDGELDLYDEQNRHCGLNSNGEMEENIPDVTCTTSGNTKHAFVKKKAAKVKVKATRKKRATSSKTTNIKKRTYRQDKISKTAIYKDINIPLVGKLEFDLDPTLDTSPSLILYPDESSPDNTTINPTSETTGSAATDQTPPITSIQISGTKDSSGIYAGPITITLTGNDADSGILKIEYSLDNGQTVQIYDGPFTISTPGTTTIQIKSIDNLGNEEIPQTITIQIAASPTPTPTSTASTTASNTSEKPESTSEVNVTATTTSSASISSPSDVLGITFKNPSQITEQINTSDILGAQKKITVDQNSNHSAKEILGGLLMVSGGIVTLASFGLLATFLKPIPK